MATYQTLVNAFSNIKRSRLEVFSVTYFIIGYANFTFFSFEFTSRSNRSSNKDMLLQHSLVEKQRFRGRKKHDLKNKE